MKITTAAVAVWMAFSGPMQAPAPAPQKCCGECGGTGMVWTGDRLARVACPCPPTCACAKNRPKMTCSGPNCTGETVR